MSSFVIEGGFSLKGKIKPQGAKNEALQVVSSVLLTSEEVIIENVPNKNLQGVPKISKAMGNSLYTIDTSLEMGIVKSKLLDLQNQIKDQALQKLELENKIIPKMGSFYFMWCFDRWGKT